MLTAHGGTALPEQMWAEGRSQSHLRVHSPNSVLLRCTLPVSHFSNNCKKKYLCQWHIKQSTHAGVGGELAAKHIFYIKLSFCNWAILGTANPHPSVSFYSRNLKNKSFSLKGICWSYWATLLLLSMTSTDQITPIVKDLLPASFVSSFPYPKIQEELKESGCYFSYLF